MILRMSRKDKQLAKLRNPAADNNWTLAEVLVLLQNQGYVQVGGKSSHIVLVSPNYDEPLTLAAHGKKSKAVMCAPSAKSSIPDEIHESEDSLSNHSPLG